MAEYNQPTQTNPENTMQISKTRHIHSDGISLYKVCDGLNIIGPINSQEVVLFSMCGLVGEGMSKGEVGF